MRVRFTSKVQLRGVNPYVLVDRERVNSLKAGWRKPMPVIVRLSGRSAPQWRTNLMPTGDGRFYLYLHGEMRRSIGTVVGDRVQVDLAFDLAYRGGPQQPAPRWFATALRADPRARQGWSALPPSRKKEIIRYFARLQSAEARDRNLTRVVRVLAGAPGRFMGRDWVDGS